MPNSPVIFLVIAVVAVGVMALLAMTLTGRHSHTFDVQEYQTRWLKVENSLVRDDPRSYAMAVISADRLLDRALNELSLPGKTMGERLKRVADKFENPRAVWSAHYLRNKIAHNDDFEVEYAQANRALAAFKQALKDLGAI